MNTHSLKNKLKHINRTLAQHYKKKEAIIINIEQLESVRSKTKEQIREKIVKNKKGVVSGKK